MKQRLTVVLAGVLAVGISGGAWAAGSTSSSSTYGVADKLDKAETAIDAGKYQDAIPILEEVVRTDPANADAYNYLGFALRNLGDYAKSLTYYDKALELDPKHKGANEYLGELYLKLGQPDKAEAQLARLNEICTANCEEYVELKTAIESYRKSASN